MFSLFLNFSFQQKSWPEAEYYIHCARVPPSPTEPYLKTKNAGHNTAIVGEPYNVDAHAKIPGLFLNMLWAFITKPTLVPIILLFSWLLCAHYCTVNTHANLLSVLCGLFELCVYTNTVHWPTCTVLYSCTEVPLWPIRASHPSRGHHTPHRQSQMLSSV